MSLAIGLRGAETVVVATDSRATSALGIRDDRTKLRVVADAFLACVGDDEIADAISAERCTSPDSGAVDLPAVWSELWRSRVAVTQTTMQASGRHVDAILAFGDRHLRLVSTRTDPVFTDENICWSGVTRNAAFLAESHWRPDLDSTHLVRLAVATIHETGRVRPEVGGPIQVGILDRDG
ncbi:MAG: Ntn hydrolase family protein, partial [Acidimicrobiales bacterium]